MFKDAAPSQGLEKSAVSTHIVCSLASALVSVVLCNPVDVLRTRLFNQPPPVDGQPPRYVNGFDAIGKIMRTEGPLAFFKGVETHFFRLGPHMVLVFTIMEQLKAVVK